jgi:glycosyltransferase involved in cell wall biosynthesis
MAFLNTGYHPAMYQGVRSALARRDFDAVLGCSLYTSCYSGLVRKPFVIDVIDALPAGLRDGRRRATSLPGRITRELLYRSMLRETKRIDRPPFRAALTTTAIETEKMRGFLHRTPVFTIPNGLPPVSKADTQEAAHPAIIMTGSMSAPANAEAAVFFAHDVFPAIRRSIPDAEFQVVGLRPTPEVRALADIPGVTVTGFVPDAQAYVGKAWVVVAPMLHANGVQNKVLDGMVMGKPIVATPRALMGIQAEPQRFSRAAEGPANIADAVVGLLRDAHLRRTLGEEGRLIVQALYSWDAAVDRLHSILAQAGAQPN